MPNISMNKDAHKFAPVMLNVLLLNIAKKEAMCYY